MVETEIKIISIRNATTVATSKRQYGVIQIEFT